MNMLKEISGCRFLLVLLNESEYKRKIADMIGHGKRAHKMDEIRDAMANAIKKNNCSILIFDSITSLLIYHEASSIVRFTHNLLNSREHGNAKNIFISIKDSYGLKSENSILTKDIGMFADKTIDICMQ
jgi:predicted small metal-binding protein